VSSDSKYRVDEVVYGGLAKRGIVNRVELEVKLNDGRNWLFEKYGALSHEQLHRPLTKSQHDPDNLWSALDHLAHLALIERDFAAMVRRYVSGSTNPVGLLNDEHGQQRSRAEIMAIVNERTEQWQREHCSDSFSDVVALTAAARGATLQLIAELSDEQLAEQLPGAPWADGSISGVLGANADHGRTHWKWIEEAGVLAE
jgi:DinB superfamily